MENFSNHEKVDIHFIYGYCNGNAHAAVREYQRRFPARRLPHWKVFVRLHRNLLEYGSFERARGQGRPMENYNYEDVLNRIEENPQISLRTLETITNIPKSNIGKITKMQGLHPFHYKRVQDLKEEDFPGRVEFCRWILNHPNAYRKILWSDEATFSRSKGFNSHNTHFWSVENPRVVRRTNYQHRFSFNLWAGMVGDKLIGPIILPHRLTGRHYLHFLQNDLGDLLDDVPIGTRLEMIFQHDGAPAHYSRLVRNWLDDNFTGRWIGRGGPINWPARSPDLNPLDYYLWGNMCNIIYATEIDTPEELHRRIIEASDEIKENRFEILRSTQNIRKRSRLCIQENGNLFEHLPQIN